MSVLGIPLPAAILAILAGLYLIGVIAWAREEYWSVYEDRARFLPGSGMFHSLFYTEDKQPKFSKGLKSGPSITPGN